LSFVIFALCPLCSHPAGIGCCESVVMYGKS
jgi:hypothetical protein